MVCVMLFGLMYPEEERGGIFGNMDGRAFAL